MKPTKHNKFNLFIWIKNLFINPDKKKKSKRDWIKWFARRHYIFNFTNTLLIDLILLIIIGFNFKLLIVSIPLIILTIPLIILTIFNLINLIRYITLNSLVFLHKQEIWKEKSRVDFRKGPPGSGKSTQTLYEAVVLAEKCWNELQYKYWLYQGIQEKYLSDFQKQEKQEVIEAFKFYNKENTIPCLWTNVPCKDEFGRYSNRLTSKHLLQKERLPYLSVLFSDEIGSEFEAQKGKVNPKLKNLSLLGRFIRHFLDGFWRLTEQDEKKSFIDIRRVVERVVMCLTQTWIMKPLILYNFYEKLKNKRIAEVNKINKYKFNSKSYNKLERKTYRTSVKYSKLMKNLKHYIDCVGFRKYIVEEREINESDGTILNLKQKTFYTESCLNIKYNDRCFHNLYKCKDKALKPCHFKCDFLTDEDISEMYKEDN